MKELEVAKVYSKAIYEISEELKVDISNEITRFSEAINSSNDLENVLFLDVFSNSEKKDVVSEIAEKLKLSKFFLNVINMLIDEKRINLLPLMFKEIVVIEDHKKGFLRGTIESGSSSISPETIKQFKSYILKNLNINSELTFVNNKKITSGFKVLVEDYLIDASVNNQLDKIKNLFIN